MQQRIKVNICPMYPDVVIPKYQTRGSAGCDVRAYLKTKDNETSMESAYRITVGMRSVIIPTGLMFSVPEGYYIAIVPRSGMAAKTTMRIANQPGTLDSDFTGELKIIVDNIGTRYDEEIVIQHQDRIAQLIFLPSYQADFNLVTKLSKTERGSGGFGSTGTA